MKVKEKYRSSRITKMVFRKADVRSKFRELIVVISGEGNLRVKDMQETSRC